MPMKSEAKIGTSYNETLGLVMIREVQLPDSSILRAYAADQPMKIECVFKVKIEVVGASKPPILAEFLVVPRGRRSLLGRGTASDMGLLKVGLLINSFTRTEDLAVFPKMPGVRIRFSTDETVQPEKNAYYNVPAAYREGAKQRLQEMEKRGIIEKVTSAPEWISGMSAVSKGKDDFRLVVNMRAPNKAIKREYYRLPLIQEMKTKLHGAKYFSKLDLTSAFYHLELAKESRNLTTFLTENGMFRFTRLMFGVNCAPEIFQREMSRILKDIDNVIVYIDDILIFGKTIDELRKTVAKVLQVLRANNLTLNIEKCEFDKDHIKFLGHELDQRGFHIDEAKVKHIQKFRKPTTSCELRSFLGLASFVSPYISNFADVTSPLALSRADGWALRLSPYSYTVEYVEGKFNIADPSSRLYAGKDEAFDEAESPWEIAKIEANKAGFLTEEHIKQATSENAPLFQVMTALESRDWPTQLRRFEMVAAQLYVKNGILVKRGCAVIPKALQRETLEIAQKGHPMSAKLKSILRERVWWPGLPKDAEDWVKSCEVCATNGRPESVPPMERIMAPRTI
ncbi:uncharacterized protein K02A2.6-like [Topomyia yanbarensis]|uniref:uncharacterized protein K02A2.6-like n=1 Tax=Topomyia yanbarensis TaxID=2498891 RepID=UPI00273C6AAC|nr:uncharacterized protein K02A2.6-like [Topomyia yanbarensis]